MARYKVQGPDGVEHELEGPDGATDAQIIAAAHDAFGAKDKLPAAVEADKVGLEEPPEQKLLNNVNAVGAGMGVAQLAGGAAKLGMKAVSEGTSGIRNEVSSWLAKKAEEQAAKATGITTSNATELIGKDTSADAVRRFGRNLLDKKVVTPYASTEGMLQKTAPMVEEAGAGIQNIRDVADLRAKPPAVDSLLEQANKELAPKFSSGLRSGEQGAYQNALDELVKQNPGTHTDLAGVATDLNAFAKSPRSLTQPMEATTDVANLVARESDKSINSVLSAPEQLEYAGLKDDYGLAKGAQDILRRSTGRDLATGGTTPVTHFGLLQKGVNAITPATTRATVADKISNALRTDPQSFERWGPVLQRAMQSGKASLNSTIYMLQQQDPDFKSKFEELNNQ